MRAELTDAARFIMATVGVTEGTAQGDSEMDLLAKIINGIHDACLLLFGVLVGVRLLLMQLMQLLSSV